MEKTVVFISDATFARHVLQPMLGARCSPSDWILVACPPALPRHVGRWLSAAARENWHRRWAVEQFACVQPLFGAHCVGRIEQVVASGPLIAVVDRLMACYGDLRLLDARRQHFAYLREPLTRQQPPLDANRWAWPAALTTGLSALLALAD